jgi:membrane protease subunit (stomatin/prohibitin family)
MSDRVVRGGEHEGRIVVRHPSRSFAAGTEIVTGQNESAALVRDGRTIVVIPPGKTRVMDAAQAPFLAPLAEPGGASFTVDIFFVRTSPIPGVRFGAKKTILDARAHEAVPVSLTGEASVRIAEAGKFAVQVAANPSLEKDPAPALAKTLADAAPDAVEKTLAEKIGSVLDFAKPDLVVAVTERMKAAVAERRAGIELLSLHALDVSVEPRIAQLLRSKHAPAGRGCPGCGVPIGAGWAKYCPECGATLPG